MTTLTVRTYHRDDAAVQQEQTAAQPLGGNLAALWRGFVAWRLRRQMRRLLYGMQPRLLDDIGVDPATVYDAFTGTLDEVQGDRFRGFPAGRQRRRL